MFKAHLVGEKMRIEFFYGHWVHTGGDRSHKGTNLDPKPASKKETNSKSLRASNSEGISKCFEFMEKVRNGTTPFLECSQLIVDLHDPSP